MIIEVLYPEVCNLYGDLFNAEYLARCAGGMQLHRTGLKDEPLFVREPVGLVYMGGTTEQGQELCIQALRPYMDALRQRMEEGQLFLVTGNATELFGSYIQLPDGSRLEGLGLYDTWAVRDMEHRYNALFLGELPGVEGLVTGYKSQFGHSYGNNEETFLLRVERGCGLNPDSGLEGIRINNFMATYLTGPLVVLNPPFAKYLLGLMGAEDALPCEQAAWDAYEVRVKEFQQPELQIEY